MTLIERNMDQASLPLVVVPNCVPSLSEPLLRCIDRFDGKARVQLYAQPKDVTDPAELVARCTGADAVIVLGFHVTDAMFEAMQPSVRCFAFGGTGIANYVNVPLAKQRGVRICNVRHYGDQSVAEHAVALMFELAKRTGRMDAQMHKSGWPGFDAIQLGGRTLGIAGFGGIGKATARIARGIGMNVMEWSRSSHAAEAEAMGVTESPSLEHLFETCDIVSLHMTLSAQSEGIIGAGLINKLKPGAMLINTARSQLVDSPALLARLQKGDISAGLDVFDAEPLPDDSPLRGLANAVITPHNAWRTDAASEGIVQQCVDSVLAWLDGKAVNVVV